MKAKDPGDQGKIGVTVESRITGIFRYKGWKSKIIDSATTL